MSREEPFLSACLTASYRNKPAVLRAAFLQMREGEVLGLVGRIFMRRADSCRAGQRQSARRR